MNLAIRGLNCDLGDEDASTFTRDKHPNLRADYILANPPFNLKNWRTANELTNDARWKRYEVPPVSNANYAWILHMLSRLSYNGTATFLLANGALNADSEEYKIRKQLIENKKIEAIIVLLRNMFYATDSSKSSMS
jgi:type I restriction enzyme M protein